MCERCVRICNAINELTSEFGDNLMIANVAGYPTAKGTHCVSIVDRNAIFEGKDLLECLESAVTAKRDEKGHT